MDGWKTIPSFWVSAYFQVQFVSFREGTPPKLDIEPENDGFQEESPLPFQVPMLNKFLGVFKT